jgi:hypothetical protein
MATPYEPHAIFDQYVSSEFQKATLRCLFGAYYLSVAECTAIFPVAETHDLRPHYVRARFDAGWRFLVTENFPGIKATPEPNQNASSYHTAIEVGPVILTASAVAAPGELVRWAEFRETLARWNQVDLFTEEAPLGTRLYAILLHGVDQGNRKQPAFAQIAFPAPDCRSYLGRTIDLMARFPQVVRDLSNIDEETVKDDLWPELRRKRDQEEEGS